MQLSRRNTSSQRAYIACTAHWKILIPCNLEQPRVIFFARSWLARKPALCYTECSAYRHTLRWDFHSCVYGSKLIIPVLSRITGRGCHAAYTKNFTMKNPRRFIATWSTRIFRQIEKAVPHYFLGKVWQFRISLRCNIKVCVFAKKWDMRRTVDHKLWIMHGNMSP